MDNIITISDNSNLLNARDKIALSLLVLALTFFSVGINFAKAETATTTVEGVPVCELSAALDELLAVKDGTLTGIARDRAEFKARKAVIVQTIICAREEIAGTEARLNELKLTAPEDEALRTQFLASLKTSGEIYATYADAVATSTGLTDIKNLAEDILTWRKTVYLPLLSQINDFILVINNEQSTKIARARFEKISGTISILRLANVASIKNLLDESAALTAKADKLNADAHELVLGYFVPVNSTSTASEATMLYASGTPTYGFPETINGTGTIKESVGSAGSGISEPKTAPTVVSLIKSSIGSLKGAYTNYLKISVMVRNILGL